MKYLASVTAVLCLTLAIAADAQTSLQASVETAMAAENRPAADKARDTNRKPAETLAFFGLEPDMRVLELVPGGAWYTRLLASVLHKEGKLYAAIGTGRLEKSKQEGLFERVEIMPVETESTRTKPHRLVETTPYTLGVSDLDMVLTFRNLHNFTALGRRNMNQAAFDALASGGIYGVVDHTRRHGEPISAENRRRLDPVVVIKEITDIGFEFVAFSDMHYKPSDELTLEVGHEIVSGASDRFTLKFRKP